LVRERLLPLRDPVISRMPRPLLRLPESRRLWMNKMPRKQWQRNKHSLTEKEASEKLKEEWINSKLTKERMKRD